MRRLALAPVVICLFGALATPRAVARGQAADARTRSDSAAAERAKSYLRNLVVAEEQYYWEHSRYTTIVAEIERANPKLVLPESFRTPVIVAPAPGAWQATLRSDTLVCGVAVNFRNPVSAAMPEGLPVCVPAPQDQSGTT